MVFNDLIVHALQRQEEIIDVLEGVSLPSSVNAVDDLNRVFWAAFLLFCASTLRHLFFLKYRLAFVCATCE